MIVPAFPAKSGDTAPEKARTGGIAGELQISPDEARITGDEKALLYLAKTLLALRHEEPGSVRQIHSGRTALRIVYGHAENGRNINDCL